MTIEQCACGDWLVVEQGEYVIASFTTKQEAIDFIKEEVIYMR